MIIGVAQRPARGEIACGDRHLVLNGEHTTIAVVDGLGHGPKAEEAARAFCDVVAASDDLGLDAIIRKATARIAGTRGVAAALVRVDKEERTMAFSGIGNIELRALSKNPIRPVCIPGIVGRKLRKVKLFEYELAPGDLVLLHTDGISTRFDLEELADMDVQQLADEILDRFGKYHDDATCLAFRTET